MVRAPMAGFIKFCPSPPNICFTSTLAMTDPIAAIVNTCNGTDVLMTMVDGKILYEKDHWDVGIEVARSIARVIEIRGTLRM